MAQEPPPIYLDHAATTPGDPRVFEAMRPFFTDHFGNPASRHHAFGRAAREAVEAARARVAALLGAEPEAIYWTSGATESNHLAILGTARALREKGRHLVTAAHEHPSVLAPMRRLAQEGFELTLLAPGPGGIVTPEQVAESLRPDTVLVSLMGAHHELGVCQDVAAVGRHCKAHGVIFHTDATAWVGRMPTDVEAAGVDLLSCSAHKFYGPKGVGALYVRRRGPRVRPEPIFEGGGQERGLRSGTPNVPGIVGIGAAAALAEAEREAEAARLAPWRDHLEATLTGGFPGARITGAAAPRLPHVIHLAFPGLQSERLVEALSETLAVSAGSACSSGTPGPSPALRAIGLPESLARGALRVSLGRFNTGAELERAARLILEAATRIRAGE